MEQVESSSFKFAAFDEVVTITNGQVDPREVPYRDMVHIGPEDVEERSGRLLSPKIAHTLGLISGKYPFESGQVIYSKIRPHLRKVTLAPFDGVCSADMYPMRPIDGRLLPEFLYYVLLSDSFTTQAVGFQERTGIPKINRSQLSAIRLPVPPMAEQRAIARAMRAVQAAKNARRRELDLERERRAVLTVDLFTHGTRGGSDTVATQFGSVPSRWDAVELDGCSVVQTGVAKGRDLNGSSVVEMPYLRVANVQDGYLDLTEVKTVTVRESEVDRYALQDGDVVLTEGGDFDKLGRGFIWHGQISPCLHQNHVFAVRPDRRRLLPEFLTYLFGSPYGKAYFLSVAHKTTNLACINTAKLKRFPVILPDLDEQEQIVDALRACDRSIAARAQEVILLDELFRAVLEELMSGRLSSVPLIEAAEGEMPT